MDLDVVLVGDSREVLKNYPDNFFDSVVTDPPYELGFMGKKWDSTGIAYDVDMWREVLRVLKPGGHLLSFGGTRTYHRMASAIEDAGFEIRDQLQWLYGTGFPKSMDISKAIDKAAGARPAKLVPATPEAQQWDGWGTALKPANEPIALARKPLSERTIAANVLKWGTGGINVDGSRIGSFTNTTPSGIDRYNQGYVRGGAKRQRIEGTASPKKGRFPANVILDESAAALLDEQTGDLGCNYSSGRKGRSGKRRDLLNGLGGQEGVDVQGFPDSGGASRFFYIAKASRRERTHNGQVDNKHPTVKPIKLMEYLITLVTPPGGVVLDPFCGSGTTLLAAKYGGWHYVGIDLNEEYAELSKERLST